PAPGNDSVELRPFDPKISSVGVLQMQRIVLIPSGELRQLAAIAQLRQAHALFYQSGHVAFELVEVIDEGDDVVTAADRPVGRNEMPAAHRYDVAKRLMPAFRVRIAEIGNSSDRNQRARDQRRG